MWLFLSVYQERCYLKLFSLDDYVTRQVCLPYLDTGSSKGLGTQFVSKSGGVSLKQ